MKQYNKTLKQLIPASLLAYSLTAFIAISAFSVDGQFKQPVIVEKTAKTPFPPLTDKARKAAVPANGTQYAEVEIALSETITLDVISALPLAPGSSFGISSDSTRLKVQIPVNEISPVQQLGADVKILRRFSLVEGTSTAAAIKTDTGMLMSSYYDYASNSANIWIPDWIGYERWVYSHIHTNDAPYAATVTSIDIHCEIVHPWIADVVVDLADYNENVSYTLWDDSYETGSDLILTETGITAFNGLFANQEWDLWAVDLGAYDTGYIDYWWIKVYYDEPFIYTAEVTEPTNTVDADSDGYYEEFDFDIWIDADFPEGTTSVAAIITCLTTGQEWEIDPWTIIGTADDRVYVGFDESDFRGKLSGRRNLYFKVELCDTRYAYFYDAVTSLPGEPIPAESKVYYRLSLSKSGKGKVIVDSISHALPWSGLFPANDTVSLRAVPRSGYVFDHWSGASSSTSNPTSVEITSSKRVKVYFRRRR